MQEFKNKVALITGAAHGFGMAIAEEAAKRGMKLMLLDQDEASLKQVAERLGKEAEVKSLRVDVTEESQIDDAVDKTIELYGEINLLVNSAGVAVPGPIWELPVRDWEWILHADLMSQVYSLRKVLPIMMKQEDGGDIINVASLAGLVTSPLMPAYYATKFAVVGMTEATAYDLQLAKQDKIHLHVFCPAFVHTNLDHSEEYRPGKYAEPGDPYYQSEAFKIGQAAAQKDIATGMPLEDVKAEIFKCLEENKFYILTHKGANPLIVGRAKNVVDNVAPNLEVLASLPDVTHDPNASLFAEKKAD